jgi:hypothetical protein
VAEFSNRSWGEISKTVEAYGSVEKYCAACLIDLNPPGEEKVASKCKLLVKEPNGKYNKNGMISAAQVLAGGMGGVDAPIDVKRKAARKLIRLYREAKMGPPESLKQLAGEK